MRSPLARRVRTFVAAVLLLAPTLVMAGGANAQDKLILRVGTDQKLETLNPWQSITYADYEMFSVQYELLVSFDINLQPTGGFADSWSTSADSKTHTFHIREGMKWSDGEPATCEDARYTYQFVLDVLASDDGYVGSGYLEPYLSSAGLESVTCDDAGNLIATTSYPTTLLTQAYIPILPEHIWSQYSQQQISDLTIEGAFANEPPVVGSGPYHAVEWSPGEFIRMERNPNYWGTPGVPDEIVYQTFGSEESMVTALRNGELDYVRGTGADQFDALANEPNIRTAEGYANGYTYLSFNTRAKLKGYGGSTSALRDVAFRDALGYAIDTQRLVDAVLNGHGVPGTTNVPPYHVNWHVEPDHPRTFDIDEANRRLDAANYPRGADGRRVDHDGKPIVLRLTWPDSEDHAADAQFIQGWFEQIGIGVDAFVTEEGKLLDDLPGPEYGKSYHADWDFYMWGWGGDPDPNSLLGLFTTDQIPAAVNDCFYSDPRYDQLNTLQQQATDTAKRKEYVAEMQQLFYDAACYHILYYDSELHAMRTDKFTGWTNQPPDSGVPLFGFGYPAYMLLRDANAAPTEGPPTAAPTSGATSGPTAGPGPTATPSNTGGGVDSTVLLIGAIVVIAVIGGGFLLMRRRGPAEEEE
jgi:peptide/nickel transport system substrate-binding protein